MTDRPQGFLNRWSRRKRAGKQVRSSDAAPAVPEERVRTQETGRASAAAPPLQRDVVARETGPGPHSPPADPEGRTTELPDLPPIESLDKDSDFSVFMTQGVPEELRRLALRKLWRLTPGVPDGLDDYDEDYSIVGVVAETVSSVSKAGQRMTDEAPEPQAEGGAEPAEEVAADEVAADEGAADEGAADEGAGVEGIADEKSVEATPASPGVAALASDDPEPIDREDRRARVRDSGRSAVQRRWGDSNG